MCLILELKPLKTGISCNKLKNNFGGVEMDYKKLLDELFDLTLIEDERKLTEKESERYIELVEVLHNNNIHIDFGINI